MNKNNKRFGWLLLAIILVFAVAACQPAEPVYDENGELLPTKMPPTATVEAPAQPASDAADDGGLIVPEFPTPEPLNWEDAITTESGLQYVEITPGNGATPQAGELVVMDYIVTLPDGTELGNSYAMGEPITVILGRGQLLEGWEEGVALMKVGGKTRMLLPPELAFGEEGYGMIPANSQIIIEVELLETKPAPEPTEVAEDDLVTTESGLQYYDIEVGEGLAAVEGSTVSSHYALWYRDGDKNVFVVSSEGTDPLTFVAGQGGMVFPGWDEGVLGMQAGGKRLLVIPPELGLGEAGGGEIPADAVLVMEIALTEVNEPVVMTEVPEEDYTVTDSGLKYYDFEVGEGAMPQPGQTVVVHYTGWLEDGTKFDSSLDRGQPFSFVLGMGQVIPGWDEGVSTMQVGGKRQLVVPPDLGYGEAGAGGAIPPGATLIFEVELLDILDQ